MAIFYIVHLINLHNKDIIELLKQNGLETKIERGNRIFPITDKAEDVLKAITKRTYRN